MDIEPSEWSEVNTESEEKPKVTSENCQFDETVESLSREIEMLVEADNEKSGVETTEHENSDVEMQLMIDEDVSEPIPEKLEQTSSNDNGCDPKISDKTDDNATKIDETTEKPNDVPDDVSTEKSTADTETSKDTTANIKSETPTNEEKKGAKRALRTRVEVQKEVENKKTDRVFISEVENKSEEKVDKSDDSLVTPEVPSVTKDKEEIIDDR